MAGGSLAAIPHIGDPEFLSDAASMHAVDLAGDQDLYILGSTEKGLVIYCRTSQDMTVDLTAFKGSYRLIRINPLNGNIPEGTEYIEGGTMTRLSPGPSVPVVLWLKKTGNSE